MLTINKRTDAYGAQIIGDFWEFDRLYFAIAKFIGEFGPTRDNPFPNHKSAAQTLLGLSYELRKAQHGHYGLYMQYNGYPHNWFMDADILRKHEIEMAKIDYLEEMGLLDDYDGDLYDADLEKLADENDDIYFALEDFDEDAVETNVANGLALRYDNAQPENTLVQLPMTYTELTYYALLLHELLSKKDLFFASKKKLADADDGWGLDEMYYYSEAHLDVDRLRLFRDQVFRSLYSYIGKEAFRTVLLPILKKESLIEDSNLMEWTQLTEKYAKQEMQNNTAESLIQFLNDLPGRS